MKTTYCNPLDLSYRYQHMNENGKRAAHREGADPTLIRFKGRYYLFVSMSAGFWHSPDLLGWEFHTDPGLLIYDYAPDVRQIGDYLYFCASRRGVNCPILRTADPLTEPFVEVSAPFDFWDPSSSRRAIPSPPSRGDLSPGRATAAPSLTSTAITGTPPPCASV